MTANQRARADDKDDVNGLPVAAGVVILMIGIVLGFLAYGVWLGANQCIRVGGCG